MRAAIVVVAMLVAGCGAGEQCVSHTLSCGEGTTIRILDPACDQEEAKALSLSETQCRRAADDELRTSGVRCVCVR